MARCAKSAVRAIPSSRAHWLLWWWSDEVHSGHWAENQQHDHLAVARWPPHPDSSLQRILACPPETELPRKGRCSVASSYSTHPAAHTSAFLLYGLSCEQSGGHNGMRNALSTSLGLISQLRRLHQY